MISFCDVITESQVGLDLQGLSCPTPLLKQRHPKQGHVQTLFKNLVTYNF